MGYQAQATVRRIEKLSIITDVVTVLLTKLTVAVRHVFIFPVEDNSSPPIQNRKILSLKDRCGAVPYRNIDVLYIILVIVIWFSLILDFPVNETLFVAVGTNDRRMCITWLIVNGIKLIGCTVIICTIV